MKMKKIMSLGLCFAMAMGLAACGSGSSKTTTSGSAAEPAKGGSGALTVNIWDANQKDGLQEICDDWTEQSGVSVKVEVINWDNYWTLLESGASGGTLPDVFWMHSDYSQVYMENDILLDLTPYIEKDGIDMGQYYEDITEIYTRDDGKIFALPKDHDTIALLYNKALFDEAGVEYPTNDWTYEDMYEAARTITENTPDDTYGVALNTSNDQDGWYNYVYAYGGNIVNEEKTDTAIDSEEGKAGMEMVRMMLTVGTPQAVVAESGTDSLFQSGKVGMITQGSWMINAFYTSENAADYAWAEMPYADVNGDGECQAEERQTCYNGLGWAASANTANPDEAAALIEYLCSEDAQVKQAELGVTMAGIPGISDAFANAFEGMDVSAFTDIETDGTLYPRPSTRNSGVWKNPMEQAGGFLDAWQNPEDPEVMSTACDNVATMIRNAIAAE
ncbi:MAG TPA: sugar ABC transporter substrate-binding protein [Lachnospiraceae bacterium]|nr:sugar ABC transporter substrate-binding protein [Lachnospiraceae bacterium]